MTLKQMVEAYERDLIIKAIDVSESLEATAKNLGINRVKLYRKMCRYNLYSKCRSEISKGVTMLKGHYENKYMNDCPHWNNYPPTIVGNESHKRAKFKKTYLEKLEAHKQRVIAKNGDRQPNIDFAELDRYNNERYEK